MQINILTQHVVQTQGPPTICSGPRHTRSCVVFLQHYYMRRPGAIARARGERQLLSAETPLTEGGNPPFSISMLNFIFRQVRG